MEARVMTHKHVTALFFSGRPHAARKRLQILKSAGLIAERPRKNFDLAVLHLTKEALRLLRDQGILGSYPTLTLSEHEARVRVSDITIRHELAVMDVKASLCAAIAESNTTSVVEFTTWPQLIKFECAPLGIQALIKPDGFIQIKTKNETRELVHSFYLELDRSTESQSMLIHRANCYLAHLKSRRFAVRSSAKGTDFREHPFRVLFVFKSAERRNNTIEALLRNNPPILTQIWLTTLEECMHDPLGAIWLRPVEYRDAVASTTFAVEKLKHSRYYQRNSRRDALIEAYARKQRLIR
jgi:hypothetical protein